jgi:endoglucanase
MKKITFYLCLLSLNLGFSQNLITNGDFENGASGWSGNAANVVIEGGNSYNAATVAIPGDPWNVNLSYVLPISPQGTVYKLTFQAWSDTTRPLIAGIGLNQAPYTSVTQSVTLGTTAQTYVLTLISNFESPTSRIIFDMGNATGFVGIDNVILEVTTTTCNNGVQDGDETGVDCGGSCPACVPMPMTAAPTPPARPAADVISLFSDAYTNITVDNWNQAPIWYAPTGKPVLDVMVATNPTKKIQFANDGFIGVVLNAYNNATSMTHFHMDYWIPTNADLIGKVLNPKWSNHPGMAGENNALLLTNLPTVAGSWVSLDVLLSTFTAQGTVPSLNREALKEFLITSNLGDVYVDNIYLHKNTILANQSFSASNIKMYPNPATNVVNIEALSNIEKVSVYNMLGQEVMAKNNTSQTVVLDVANLQSGIYIVKTVIDGVVSSSRFVKE